MNNYEKIKELCNKDDIFTPTTNIVELSIFLTKITNEKSYTRIQDWMQEVTNDK